MREIKYKAWHKIRNKMYKVWSLFWFDDGMRVDIYGMGDREETSEDIENVILIEYAGLHDKNGKEIYEGDILKFSDHFNPWLIQWKITGDNIHGGAGFAAPLYAELSWGEVIGNIYENPELLEAEYKQSEVK